MELIMKILKQIETIRKTGRTNMLMVDKVKAIAEEMGFQELVDGIDRAPDAYCTIIRFQELEF